MKPFPHYTQLDSMDCGPTSLRMIAKFYGKNYSLQNLRERSFITREGVSLLGISDAAESIGFRTNGIKTTFENLAKDVPMPCILHWNQNHFVVCYAICKKKNLFRRKKGNSADYVIKIADPGGEKYTMDKKSFLKCWISSKCDGKEVGVALLLSPTPEFYEQEDDKEKREKNLGYFFNYLRPYRSQLVQLVLGLIIGSILSLIFPFLLRQ